MGLWTLLAIGCVCAAERHVLKDSLILENGNAPRESLSLSLSLSANIKFEDWLKNLLTHGLLSVDVISWITERTWYAWSVIANAPKKLQLQSMRSSYGGGLVHSSIKRPNDLVSVYYTSHVTLDAHNIRLVTKECKIKLKLLVTKREQNLAETVFSHQVLFIMMLFRTSKTT